MEKRWELHPLHDIVVIKPYLQTISIGGILIPRQADDFHEDIGEIMYCGPEADQVKKGDMVLFSTNGHQVVKMDGEELIVLRQPSIVGRLEEKRLQVVNA